MEGCSIWIILLTQKLLYAQGYTHSFVSLFILKEAIQVLG